MQQSKAKSLCILGRLPALGVAELESLYGAGHILPIENGALLDIEAETIDFRRLGGTIKTARVLSILHSDDWASACGYLKEKIPEHLQYLPEGKLTLGVSLYGLPVRLEKLNADMLEIKKIIKKTGRPVRIVPNKALELNSAQVLHNNLTRRGGWELLLVRDGNRTILAQTLFVQDIDAYAARDQIRPKRDARVGMLPPKLAQIIINLATGPVGLSSQSDMRSSGVQGEEEQQSEPYKEYGERVAESSTQQSTETGGRVASSASKQAARSHIRVLDPFCGTGVILQEAMLMGYPVLGTDLDPRMVEYTKTNLEWLVREYPAIEASAAVEVADATIYVWPKFSCVASEVYLGRPLSSPPSSDKLKEIVNDANTITKKFLKNLAPQLKSGQKICLAVPAWRIPQSQKDKSAYAVLGAGEKRSKPYIKYGERTSEPATTHSHASAGGIGRAQPIKQTSAGFIFLPVIDQLTDIGYNYLDLKHVRRGNLIYYREGQVVARRLLRLEKA